MKRIFIILALAAVIATNAQAQKSPAAAKSAVEKAEATTLNPKQNAKTATWLKYGQALMDAYNAPSASIWVGMSRQEFTVLGARGQMGEEAVVLSGRTMTKLIFPEKNLYFNENAVLEIIEVTEPVVENALDKALSAYAKAGELDAKNQKTKDIVAALETISAKYAQDASNAYTFGDLTLSSELFEKAVSAAGTAPLSKVDTMSLYNAALTAFFASNYDRAKALYGKCLEIGYAGNEGDVYAKLADIAEKAGNKNDQKSYLEKGFAAYPQSQAILIGLINYYISSNEDPARLFSLLEDAKKNEPNNASLYYVEGNINLELKNPEAAIAAYRKCAEINPNYEFGYIGEGIYYYNRAIELQDAANNEADDAKYMAIIGEFETSLKSCIEPFEKGFEISKDVEVKKSISEYLKNACFRFRTSGEEYMAKYEKYNAYLNAE